MSQVPARHIWLILIGYIVWSLLFVGLYALQAIGCAAGWHEVAIGPTDLHRILLVAVYLGGLLALGGVLMVQSRIPACCNAVRARARPAANSRTRFSTAPRARISSASRGSVRTSSTGAHRVRTPATPRNACSTAPGSTARA